VNIRAANAGIAHPDPDPARRGFKWRCVAELQRPRGIQVKSAHRYLPAQVCQLANPRENASLDKNAADRDIYP
jgi:hypothetical protein